MMPQFIKKSAFFPLVFFVVFFFSFLSLAETNSADEKTKQLCYFKDNYIKYAIYSYRPPFFYHNSQITKKLLSVIFLNSSLFSKNPWEIEGVQVNVQPFSKTGSVIHWLKYKPSEGDNNLDRICKVTSAGFCLFKVVYEGSLRPVIQTTNTNDLNFNVINQLRVSIYDSQNNILNFPKDCSK